MSIFFILLPATFCNILSYDFSLLSNNMLGIIFSGDKMIKKYIISFLTVILSSVILMFSSNDNSSSSLVFPIHSNYYISSIYGYRTLGSAHFHNGIDIPKVVGTPVYAISSGVVSKTGFSSSYGNYIIITYSNGYKTLYGHMSGCYPFSVGDSVSSSNIVAYVGPKYLSNGKLNGFTTGPHLHFTVYKNNKTINPTDIKFEYIK